MKKIVISGGPCSGKTTIVEKFKENGYYTLPEPARIIGKELGMRFSRAITGKKRFEISNIIFEKYLEQESKLPKNTIVILDTGMPDNIPYYRYCPEFRIPKNYLEVCKNRYDIVFMLERLGSFETDGVRGESKEEALLLHNMKYAAYISLGYNPVYVPIFDKDKKISIDKRIEFIESKIRNIK